MLPNAKDILEGLLACDIIGFHLENDCIKFKESYGPDDLSKFEGRLVKCQLPTHTHWDTFCFI